jgi:hypothetical protein
LFRGRFLAAIRAELAKRLDRGAHCLLPLAQKAFSRIATFAPTRAFIPNSRYNSFFPNIDVGAKFSRLQEQYESETMLEEEYIYK